MQKQTKKHIELALESDPDINKRMRKKALDLLEGKTERRQLITTRYACEILGCHPLTLRRMEKRGHIQAIRYSARRLRWDKNQIIEFSNRGIQQDDKLS